MKVFFDVDYTILSSDYCIRTGTKETFRRLLANTGELGEDTRTSCFAFATLRRWSTLRADTH